MNIISIDPGIRNFAWCEAYVNLNEYNETTDIQNKLHSIDVDLFQSIVIKTAQNRSICNRNVNINTSTTEAIIKQTESFLHKYFDSYHIRNALKINLILIEQPVCKPRRGKFGYNVNKVVIVSYAIYLYFLYVARQSNGSLEVHFVSSKHKLNGILGKSMSHLTYDQKKAKAIELFYDMYGHLKCDNTVIKQFAQKGKRDDIADSICQLIAFIHLNCKKIKKKCAQVINTNQDIKMDDIKVNYASDSDSDAGMNKPVIQPTPAHQPLLQLVDGKQEAQPLQLVDGKQEVHPGDSESDPEWLPGDSQTGSSDDDTVFSDSSDNDSDTDEGQEQAVALNMSKHL